MPNRKDIHKRIEMAGTHTRSQIGKSTKEKQRLIIVDERILEKRELDHCRLEGVFQSIFIFIINIGYLELKYLYKNQVFIDT